MIEIKRLRQDDRDALVQFADSTRDQDLARMASDPSKESKTVIDTRLQEPIQRTIKAIRLLQDSLNPEIHELANRALAGNQKAINRLRQLGRQVKTFVA
jgi:hypothetical protein